MSCSAETGLWLVSVQSLLSLAFEILSNHVHGVHLMRHRWGVCLACLAEPQEDRRLALGIQGLPGVWEDRKEAG